MGYLTVGVAVRRKWLGLAGREGLMPREGVCVGVAVVSALKFFISCATRPIPARVGALPADLVSSEAELPDTDAPISFSPLVSWDV